MKIGDKVKLRGKDSAQRCLQSLDAALIGVVIGETEIEGKGNLFVVRCNDPLTDVEISVYGSDEIIVCTQEELNECDPCGFSSRMSSGLCPPEMDESDTSSGERKEVGKLAQTDVSRLESDSKNDNAGGLESDGRGDSSQSGAVCAFGATTPSTSSSTAPAHTPPAPFGNPPAPAFKFGPSTSSSTAPSFTFGSLTSSSTAPSFTFGPSTSSSIATPFESSTSSSPAPGPTFTFEPSKLEPLKDVYKGEYNSDGQRHGKGTCVSTSIDFKTCNYDGDWVCDKKEGMGTLVYANGDEYTGEFKDGVKSGRGVYIYKKSGDRYEGDFVADIAHGKGTLTKKNGDIFTGNYENGEKHGFGRYQHFNGDQYEGEYYFGLYLNGVFKFAGSGEERAIEADVEKLNRCVIKKLSDSTSSFSGGKKIRAPGRGRRMNPFSKQLVNIK